MRSARKDTVAKGMRIDAVAKGIVRVTVRGCVQTRLHTPLHGSPLTSYRQVWLLRGIARGCVQTRLLRA